MNDDRLRVSDADRERVAARLREHFAEGRLTSDELEERITAALSAKTFGELRRPLADLPEPAPMPVAGPAGWQQGGRPGWQPGRWGPPPCPVIWRGPRLLPLAIILAIAAIAIPGAGWLFLGFVKVVLVFWLVALLIGILTAARFARRARRYYRAGGGQWRSYEWRG